MNKELRRVRARYAAWDHVRSPRRETNRSPPCSRTKTGDDEELGRWPPDARRRERDVREMEERLASYYCGARDLATPPAPFSWFEPARAGTKPRCSPPTCSMYTSCSPKTQRLALRDALVLATDLESARAAWPAEKVAAAQERRANAERVERATRDRAREARRFESGVHRVQRVPS